MNRRDFLAASASTLAVSAWCPRGLHAQSASSSAIDAATDARAELTARFRTIVSGFLRNARATSADYTACNFPEGTKLASCCTPNGKSYTSVARMLPALAEYVAAGHAEQVDGVDLREVLRSIYRTAFDPKHPDYWGEPPANKATQRTVESSLVALALARLGPAFVGELSSVERTRVNRWLASCTRVPERTNNHAWFTAVNQATRLKLARIFPEFSGDEQWMIDDLRAMDVLAANAADGWYSDDPKLTVYDYYNFWTFGNFPLFWSRIAGELYPDWNTKLRARAREFLERTPYFFAADGAVPLFGRSLLYRWALLSPLLLGYEQGIWPHSPGLLRRIVHRNFTWWWSLGAYDEKLGKLRETLSSEGTPEVTEAYIDTGHPYWAMQAFTFFALPATDPFWTAPEEAMPVERGDFVVKFPGPRMLVAGTKASGQVRWLQARNTPRRDYYRDKYNKFAWSSAFPFNVAQKQKDFAPCDQALVLQDATTGANAWRIFPDDGELLEDGVRTTWSAKLGEHVARVISTVRVAGEFEFRSHRVTLPASASSAVKAIEGSYPLGLSAGDAVRRETAQDWLALRSARSGALLVSWKITGHAALSVTERFGPAAETRVNLVHPRAAVITLSGELRPPAAAREITLTSLHYASPRPEPLDVVQGRAKDLIARWE